MILILTLIDLPWVWGIDQLSFKLGRLTGAGWQAQDVVMQLHAAQSITLRVNIASLTLAQLKQPLKKLQLKCVNAHYAVNEIACVDAQLQLGHELKARLAFSYRPLQKQIQLTIKQLNLAGGHISGQAKSTPQGWSAQLKINQVDMAQLHQKLQAFMNWAPSWNFSGQSVLTVDINHHEQATQAQITGEFTQLSFSNAAGSQAGEQLKLEVALKIIAQQTATQVQGKLTLRQGEVYSDPIYVGIDTTPATLTVDLLWHSPYLTLHQFKYNHVNVLLLKGNATLVTQPNWQLQQLDIKLQPTELKIFYQYYLQNWLGEQWRVSGLVTARFNMFAGQKQLWAQLTQVNIEQTEKQMGLQKE